MGPSNFLQVQQPVKENPESLVENLIDILKIEPELLDLEISPALNKHYLIVDIRTAPNYPIHEELLHDCTLMKGHL